MCWGFSKSPCTRTYRGDPRKTATSKMTITQPSGVTLTQNQVTNHTGTSNTSISFYNLIENPYKYILERLWQFSCSFWLFFGVFLSLSFFFLKSYKILRSLSTNYQVKFRKKSCSTSQLFQLFPSSPYMSPFLSSNSKFILKKF